MVARGYGEAGVRGDLLVGAGSPLGMMHMVWNHTEEMAAQHSDGNKCH